jgi:hypothetical protein
MARRTKTGTGASLSVLPRFAAVGVSLSKLVGEG